jgi:hypothetical protein
LWLVLLSQAAGLGAAVPAVVSFQGRITVSGQPFSGPGQFKFAVLADGGASRLWNHDGSTNAEPAVWVSVGVSTGSAVFSSRDLDGQTDVGGER